MMNEDVSAWKPGPFPRLGKAGANLGAAMIQGDIIYTVLFSYQALLALS